MTPEPDAPIVPQRAVFVLPSNGAFDSRMYRIATTLLGRGHSVVVLARLAPGLPAEELHPAGYRIIRVPVRAIDGLPFQGLIRLIRGSYAGRRRRRSRAAGRAPIADTQASSPASASAFGPASSALPGPAPAAGVQAAAATAALRDTIPGRVVRAIIRRLTVPLTIRAQTRAMRGLEVEADLYHGMAYMGIPVALALAKRAGAPVVYDARDIYLEARSFARMRGISRWLFAAAERRWAARCARVITVNEDYADVIGSRLRVRRPLVVMNCSARFDPPEPRERRFHELLGLAPGTPVVLYHGGLFPERGIEQLMAAWTEVPDAVLVLMGYGMLEASLRTRAEDPALGGRVRIVPAVRPDELHAWVAAADIAAMPIQPSTLNHRLTTPNKLFEAMAAGVAVVASDLPGMARIINETGCGVVCDGTSPSAIAATIRDLLADPERRAEMGLRGRTAARDTYNWERQAAILLDEYGAVTGSRW